jgi:hypothetical protein
MTQLLTTSVRVALLIVADMTITSEARRLAGYTISSVQASNQRLRNPTARGTIDRHHDAGDDAGVERETAISPS